MPRVLLILPTGTYRAADFVRAASVLGAEVVVASEHRQAMARAMEDRALVVPLGRPEAAAAAIVELARRRPLDAVVAVDEQGVLAAALAGERLGLAHNSPAAVAATRDKAAARAVLAAAGVAQPAFRVVGSGGDVAAAAVAVGLPCVVKPVSLSGSRGVIRADDPASATVAAERIRNILDDAGEDGCGPLLVETFVPGSEVALEGLLRSGELEVLALFDKPDPLDGPYFEETIYVTPSRLPEPVQAAVAALVAAGAAALGLREGPVHAEVRVDGDDVTLLEIAGRSIGGLCARALRFGAGISLEEVILRHALGLRLGDLRREDSASGVMMVPIPRSGVLQRVGGVDAARAVPGVEGVELTVARGRRVVALPEGDRYLGFIFARRATPEDVEASLRAAHVCLEVEIADAEETS
ncbi:MAG TPA: ATP-grasp domain-containing protein [Acidimicrobiales bacterium]|nr:ATP-grasp domain-containing protein [Acidimicrobiales bacterium]